MHYKYNYNNYSDFIMQLIKNINYEKILRKMK